MACLNNLKDITVAFPLGVMTCVTGVSGSGKSSLVIETLYKEVKRYFEAGSWRSRKDEAGSRSIAKIRGLSKVDKVVDIDQSPIGRTPRSNPATYTGVLTPVRELLARVPEARARGYKPGRFSFNVKGGRCEACEGDGVIKIAMHFLPDIYVTCETCGGRRYNRETLGITYRGKNIAEILAMNVEEALQFFRNVPVIRNRLQTLYDVGLVLSRPRPVFGDPLRRRGPAHQTGPRIEQTQHRQYPLYPRRTDHRPASRPTSSTCSTSLAGWWTAATQ